MTWLCWWLQEFSDMDDEDEEEGDDEEDEDEGILSIDLCC